ncbi:MAG: hypothetical protein HDT22_00190 [Ruminococcus sp.]|nr:hypothetical protein [Ruminococcus sp.]
MSHYALWLTDKQKNLILKYIQDRRYQYMISMYLAFILTIIILIFDLPYLLITNIIFLDIQSYPFVYNTLTVITVFGILTVIIAFGMFFMGIGKIFGKNSDYDCMKHDKYRLDFRDFGGKSFDTGKYPYYVENNFYNRYICPIFLDYRNAKQGDTLICVTLNNGKKYALLEKIDLEK